jgi:hypothetical protein
MPTLIGAPSSLTLTATSTLPLPHTPETAARTRGSRYESQDGEVTATSRKRLLKPLISTDSDIPPSVHSLKA